MEFITTCHKSTWITNILQTFKMDIGKLTNKFPKPSVVVTDFSYALINAVMTTFNEMTLQQYLKTTYRFLTSPDAVLHTGAVTILNICKAHMMKALSVKLAKVERNATKRKACLVVFARLQESSTIKVCNV
jgi:hypothetical protein